MATITAQYLDDLGRVRITASDLIDNATYVLERSTDQVNWTAVRAGGNVGTDGVTLVDDYEYVPNEVNYYRLVAPTFVDSFQRIRKRIDGLHLPNSDDAWAQTPDTADLDIANDFDLQTELRSDDYDLERRRHLVGKWNPTGDQRSYALEIAADGTLQVLLSGDGAEEEIANFGVGVPVPNGVPVILRAVVSVDNTDGSYTAECFWDDGSIPITGTQIGVTATGTLAATSLFDSSAPLRVGARGDGEHDAGPMEFGRVRLTGDGGTLVADAEFSAETPGTTSFTGNTGKTWTLDGDAEIIDGSGGADWGEADTGELWNLGGSSPGFWNAVDDGIGIMADTDATGLSSEQLTDAIVGAEDAEIEYAVSYPDNALDDTLLFNLGIRADGFNDHYDAQILFADDAASREVTARLVKTIGGTETVISGTLVAGTWTPGVPWNVRFRVNASQLRLRIWQQGEAEPNTWQINVTDSDHTTGTGVYVYTSKDTGDPYRAWFGPMQLHTIPADTATTTSITPPQTEVFLKSIMFPFFNQAIECVDWDVLTRESRAGFFNVKGRHPILAITDVGSSGTFNLIFVTETPEAARAVAALITYGGTLFLQPPGEPDVECHSGTYSGIPSGYVVPDTHDVEHSIRGKPTMRWVVEFVKVAAADTTGITPALITWSMLWDLIGPEGTWEDVWATWDTWQEMWSTPGNFEAFGE